MTTTAGSQLNMFDPETTVRPSSSSAPGVGLQSPIEPTAGYLLGQTRQSATTRNNPSHYPPAYEGLSSPDRPARIRHCPTSRGPLSSPRTPLRISKHQQSPSPESELSDTPNPQRPPSPESDAGNGPELSELARLRLSELKLKLLIRKHESYLAHRDYDEPELHRGKKAEADAMLTRAGRHAGSNYRLTQWDHEWDDMVAGAARVLVGEPFEKTQQRQGKRRMARASQARTPGPVDEEHRKRKDSVFEISE